MRGVTGIQMTIRTSDVFSSPVWAIAIDQFI
jgi:hypothetical protein